MSDPNNGSNNNQVLVVSKQATSEMFNNEKRSIDLENKSAEFMGSVGMSSVGSQNRTSIPINNDSIDVLKSPRFYLDGA